MVVESYMNRVHLHSFLIDQNITTQFFNAKKPLFFKNKIGTQWYFYYCSCCSYKNRFAIIEWIHSTTAPSTPYIECVVECLVFKDDFDFFFKFFDFLKHTEHWKWLISYNIWLTAHKIFFGWFLYVTFDCMNYVTERWSHFNGLHYVKDTSKSSDSEVRNVRIL